MSLVSLLGRALDPGTYENRAGGVSGFQVDLTGALAAARDMLALPPAIVRAQKRAIGTVVRRLPVEARRDMQKEYRLKASRIRQGLRMRATQSDIRLVGSARGINAAAFGATWSRRNKVGAKFAGRKDQSREQHAGTFIATGRSGNRLVFERTAKGTRLPLRAVYLASIGQMLKHGQRPARLADYAQGVIVSEINRQLDTRATP